MRRLRLWLLSILTGLVATLSAKDQLREKPPEEKQSSDPTPSPEDDKPPNTSQRSSIASSDDRGGQAVTLYVDRQPDDRAYKKAQIALMKRQVRAAEKLNRVTVCGTVGALIGILVLIATLRITKASLDAAKESAHAASTFWPETRERLSGILQKLRQAACRQSFGYGRTSLLGKLAEQTTAANQ
jgi:hypothetical protein